MSGPAGNRPPREGYRREPWDTPERRDQAIAHGRALRRRRSRRRLLFLAALVSMLLVLLLCLALVRGGSDTGSTSARSGSCPSQTVAAPADTTIRVLNATGRNGLAAGVARTLKSRGYTLETVSNAQAGSTGEVTALVVYGSGQQAQARAVAAQVAGARLKTDSRTSDTVDLILGTRFTALRTPEQAAPYLEQASVPAGCPAGS